MKKFQTFIEYFCIFGDFSCDFIGKNCHVLINKLDIYCDFLTANIHILITGLYLNEVLHWQPPELHIFLLIIL